MVQGRFSTFFLLFFSQFLIFGSFVSKICAQNSISINQVIDLTMANNPSLKVSRQRMSYAEGSYRVSRSTFNTNLRLSGQQIERKTPFFSNDTTTQTSTSQSRLFNLSATRRFGFGTEITPSLALSQNAFTNATYSGSSNITVLQPLGRGLGSTYNKASLNISQLNISSQENLYLYDASSLLYSALSAYIEYVSALRNLNIQRTTERSMQETVRQLGRLVELDAIPGSELVVSQANLSNQHTNTALAENRLDLAENVLANAMGMERTGFDFGIDTLKEYPSTVNLVAVDEGYTTFWKDQGVQLRNDYKAIVNEQTASEISLSFAKKGMLPQVDLTFGAGYNSIGRGTGFNPYYDAFVNNIPGMSYSVGLVFNIAPRYDAEKGRRIQALALMESANANRTELELRIQRDIRRDCERIRYYTEALKSANDAAEFNKQALENEIKKLDLGLSTAFNVALMQNNYLNALDRQNSILAELNIAILRFKYDTGTLLSGTGDGQFNINVNELFILPESR